MPCRAAPASDTAKPGSQRSCHASANVPSVRVRSGLPHGTPSTASLRSSFDRSRSLSLRRSSRICLPSRLGGNFSLRCDRARSAASGEVGTPAPTSPRRSPITSFSCTSRRWTSSPPQSTANAASLISDSPGDGLPRNAASVSASRTASTAFAVDAGRSSSRSTEHARANQRGTESPRSAHSHRWAYQPGESTPAP